MVMLMGHTEFIYMCNMIENNLKTDLMTHRKRISIFRLHK